MIILPKNRDTTIFNRLYIGLYIKLTVNNGKNRDSTHAAISICPWQHPLEHLLLEYLLQQVLAALELDENQLLLLNQVLELLASA